MTRTTRRRLVLLALILAAVACTTACSPNEAQVIAGLIPVAQGFVAVAVLAGDAILPAEMPLIQTGGALVAKALSALQNTLQTYQQNPGTNTLTDVQQGIAAVNANLTDLEAAAQVKDPATAKELGQIVLALQSTVAATKAALLAKHPAVVASAQATAAINQGQLS